MCGIKDYIKSSTYYYIMENLVYKIVKKPSKKGDNYYFNIPIEFIRSGTIDPEREYEILVFKITK